MEEYKEERPEIMAAVEKVFSSGKLILGESVAGFERNFAAYNGTRFGVGVNSGTDAIFLALKSMGIGQGDEVITVSNTAIPTVAAIVSTGATPVFVDIDPSTYLMDVSKLEAKLTSRTKCILPVHLYGQCADMEAISRIAPGRNLFVLEDCAQSTGALQKGKKSGSMGHASAFSFYPTKILGAYGDGGMVLTSDQELAERIRRIRMYGTSKTYYSFEHGYNSRLDEVQAEILNVKLKRLDQYISRRQQLARLYDRELEGMGLVLPATTVGNEHAYYLYVVRHPRRDEIISELAKREIFVNISYPHPIHLMEGYRFLAYERGAFPETEKAAGEIFSLPMYPKLTDDQALAVCKSLREIMVRLG